LRERMGFER